MERWDRHGPRPPISTIIRRFDDTRGTTISLDPPTTDGNEQLAKLVAKYRARQKWRLARPNPNAETLEEFGQRVFGTEVGQQVLLEYLQEHTEWTLAESEAEEAADPPNGR